MSCCVPGAPPINFTLHFHLAHRDTGSPDAAVGAMLPDLWRMAHRSVRPAPRGVAAPGDARDAGLGQVLSGIDHHTRADAVFHASAEFREGERALAERLAVVGAPRLTLFAHVALELCLDGALVVREPALPRRIADAVSSARRAPEGESPVSAAARIHHAARKGEVVPPGFEARLDWILGELAGGEWIAGYGRGDVVAARVEGLRGRLGLPGFEPPQRAAAAAIFDDAIAGGGGHLDATLARPISRGVRSTENDAR